MSIWKYAVQQGNGQVHSLRDSRRTRMAAWFVDECMATRACTLISCLNGMDVEGRDMHFLMPWCAHARVNIAVQSTTPQSVARTVFLCPWSVCLNPSNAHLELVYDMFMYKQYITTDLQEYIHVVLCTKDPRKELKQNSKALLPGVCRYTIANIHQGKQNWYLSLTFYQKQGLALERTNSGSSAINLQCHISHQSADISLVHTKISQVCQTNVREGEYVLLGFACKLHAPEESSHRLF